MGFGGQVAHGSWKKTFDFGGNPEWGWVMVRVELWLLLDGAPPYPRREDTCFPVTYLVVTVLQLWQSFQIYVLYHVPFWLSTVLTKVLQPGRCPGIPEILKVVLKFSCYSNVAGWVSVTCRYCVKTYL